MSSQSNLRTYARDFSKSKSGMIGLVLLIILIVVSLYVLVAFPSNIGGTWNNPKSWEANPAKAPPAWIGVFTSAYPPTISFADKQWGHPTFTGSYYNYSNTYNFQWTSSRTPSDVILIPRFNGTLIEVSITWMKPDGLSCDVCRESS